MTTSYRNTEKLLEQTTGMMALLYHRITNKEDLTEHERQDVRLLLAAYKERK